MSKFFLIKFFTCVTISFLTYLSLRIDLIYKNNNEILISFIAIQLIIWSIFLFPKKKFFKIVSYNIFFIVFLNLILTPLFHLITFDVPTRLPNYEIKKDYKGEFFKGMLSGTHLISYDHKGYRTNKKIDYKNKNENTLRIFTIGASTTEEGEKGNNKTWSNLLGKNLEEHTDKNVEIVNTGVAGLRAEHHYITLKRILRYKPDLIIFLMGINDWNEHIINYDTKYLIPIYEIKYNFKKSILFQSFGNINKQIKIKIFNKKNAYDKKNTNLVVPEQDSEAYLLPQIDSLNKRKIIKKFKPTTVSNDYQYWTNLMINECKDGSLNCLFLDQPTAYKKNITNKLKERLWMTPPNQIYTLTLKDLIYTSSTYNNWLKKKIRDNKLNFYLLSDKIEPNTSFLFDDCHFTENGSKKLSDILTSYINLNFKSILN